MTVLAISAGYDREGLNPKTGRRWRDATGAFIPEGKAFVRLHGGTYEALDTRKVQAHKIADTMQILGRYQGAGLRCIGLFMHGFRDGIQCGFTIRNRTTLARALRGALAPEGVVALYACDAARDSDRDRADDKETGPGGEGGFASVLARDLGAGHVDAHATAGHTTWNPWLRRFGPDGVGRWIVDPSERALWRKWRDRLQTDRAFRLTFPLMSVDEIRAGL